MTTQGEFNRRVSQLRHDVDDVYDLQVVANQKFDRFAKKTNERFRHLDGRFDAVDGRLDSVDTRLDSVDTRLDSVDTRLDSVDTRLDSVDTRLDVIGERLGEVVSLLRTGGVG
jgi:tetrahydromethanopterin S-methyltransferase subunit G